MADAGTSTALAEGGRNAKKPPLLLLWERSQRSPWVATVQFAAFAALLLWLAMLGAEQMGYLWQWYNIPQYFFREVDGEWIMGPLVKGLIVTLQIAAWCIVLTLAAGLVTALLRMSDSLTGSALATGYLELVRNTPLLVQLYLFYFVISPILGVDRFWTGIICLTFYEATFVAEIIRAGIISVDRGQWEAADAGGLTRRDVEMTPANEADAQEGETNWCWHIWLRNSWRSTGSPVRGGSNQPDPRSSFSRRAH